MLFVSVISEQLPKSPPRPTWSAPLVGMVSPFAVEMLLPAFLNGLAVKAKPPQKEATLQIISALAAKAPRAVGNLDGRPRASGAKDFVEDVPGIATKYQADTKREVNRNYDTTYS